MATNSFGVINYLLPSAVANNGTFDVGYPVGSVQADFTGSFANTADEVMVVNDNDRYGADKVDISYGSSTITVTNKTGATLQAGAKILLQLAKATSVRYTGPKGVAIASPTADAASLKVAVDAIRVQLKAAGITG